MIKKFIRKQPSGVPVGPAKFEIKNLQRGFTIIEIMIAICVLSFGIILIYNAFLVVVAFTYTASARVTASYLAQEGLEIIGNIRDNNVINGDNGFAGFLDGPCAVACQPDYTTGQFGQLAAYQDTFLGIGQDGFYGYEYGATPTIFKRKITISAVGGTSDALRVDAKVTWDYSGQPFNVDVQEYLYDRK